ncbi:MAG: tRNA uridine-5-carboxymethylaminomethyl(34) synthesis enzyme MnmG [Phycisphaerales bacterium]|nr:tRNA uridine-5-carboxymethylaminomethyl(34) synthesis enzyme MnmG [Phycisphaerales bacterium]
MPADVRHMDVVVIGGGHAGAEAAWACANLGARTALVTIDPARTGVMSCNPAIGGLAKGQIVREIDALGGLMGLAADASGIMFKALNASKGAAVRGPRAQCDKHAYAEAVQRLLASRETLETIAGAVERFIVKDGRIAGVVVAPSMGGVPSTDPASFFELRARAVVLTTGTFMRGLMHTGPSRTPGGRVGEAPAVGVSGALRELGFELGRLKTGTPPRLRRSSIDWDNLEPQRGDERPTPFSDLTEGSPFPAIEQVECRVTATNAAAHDLIRANLHRAPMYSGQIESAGPRYCPSIEDKVVRFADRDAHHVFLEPESRRDEWVYCNGVSTSLPADVQDVLVRTMPGCERAEILRYGYAVEYDMVRPHQIMATAMTKRVEGLFLAGQINGTSGYEEAAAQGLLAGVNAARFAANVGLVSLGRDEAYIGVMMDDLVTRTPVEPYRMFTSRAEHRLLLRADNSADRLTPLAKEWGTCCPERAARFERRAAELDRIGALIDKARVDGEPLAQRCKRPEFSVADLAAALGEPFSAAALDTALNDRQYAGYIDRQRAEVRRHAEMERRHIPPDVDYHRIPGLRAESREALSRFRPETYGQAGRLEGVTPADLSIVMIALKKR